MGVMKRLQLSRWVSAEVGYGLMYREVTVTVFYCRYSFSKAEFFRPEAERGNFAFARIFYYIKTGSYLALEGLKFLFYSCLG